MYCNRCGKPIPDDARFCGSCGRPVAHLTGAPTDHLTRRRLRRHLPALSLFWVIYSVLQALGGGTMIFTGAMLTPGFFFMHPVRPFGFLFYGGPFHGLLLHGLIAGEGLGTLLMGALGLATGWGLWRRKQWARMLALILGTLALFRFPIGTALGIYTYWVLVPRDSAAEYRRLIAAS